MKITSELISVLLYFSNHINMALYSVMIVTVMIIPIGTKLLPVTTTERTMKRPHTPPPAPHQRPGQDQKVKRASPGLTALPKTSTHPRNSLSGDPHHAPTLDPCPGHALAPGPGLDASLEATDRLFSKALFMFL